MSDKSMKEIVGKSLEQNGYSAKEAQRIFLIQMEATKYFQFETVIPMSMKLGSPKIE